MTEQGSTKKGGARFGRPWRMDRRCPQRLQPPPFRTAEGVIHVDRRSYLDRRSAWILDYQITIDDGETH